MIENLAAGDLFYALSWNLVVYCAVVTVLGIAGSMAIYIVLEDLFGAK